jgi:acyl carrier protein
LIIRAAPDAALAEPVRHCREDELLDNVIPFSSVILLGVVVAVEDRFGIIVTREMLARACTNGSSLRELAMMIEAHQSGTED